MRPRFLVVLTWIRQGDQARDERHRPETTAEAIGADSREAAHAIFTAMCALSAVRAGRQRAKIIPLAGQDHWEPPGWMAPHLTGATRRALIRTSARPPHPPNNQLS
jgi:hypothetical protein